MPLPPSREVAFYSAEAFTPDSIALIKSTFRQVMAVPKDEARRFACNAIVARGYAVHEVDLSEFLKSGGGAKCLTLHLDHPTASPQARPRRVLRVCA